MATFFPVISKGKNFFEVEFHVALLKNIHFPSRANVESPKMREIKLSNKSNEIFKKLKSSKFDLNTIKNLSSGLKIQLQGQWDYSAKKELFNKKNDLGFLILEDNCTLFAADALSDDILRALRKYIESEIDKRKFNVNKSISLIIYSTKV